MSNKTRQLAAIMFTDIEGYTLLMQQNEPEARKLRSRQRNILEHLIPLHNGKILQTFGDGTLSVFGSAVEAVNCAVKIQLELQTEPVCPLRIGIHLGDVTYDDKDIYGDGVNVASRIESISTSGGVFVSDKVFDEIKNQPSLPTCSMGLFEFKNVEKPIEVFALTCTGLRVPESFNSSGKLNSKTETIAVLPFANMSNDPENEYFSDGISEEILNALTKVKGLEVISRTSSFSFKGKNEDMREIGKRLGASSLIEGSVRKSGSRVRITAQLINSSDGTHYWSEVYDRELKDIFAIQDEISLDIAHKLEKQFSNVHAPSQIVTNATTSIEAYEIYLKAMYKLNFAPTKELQLEVIADLEKAIVLDPLFAKAYAILADTYVTTGTWGLLKPAIAYTKARDYSLKALSLDDKLAEAHLAFADYKIFYEWDWDSAGESIEKAMKLNPGYSGAHVNYSNYLRSRGHYHEALIHAEKAVSLDPLSVNLLNNLANEYVVLKRYEDAENTYRAALKVNPNSRPTLYEYGYMFVAKGEFQKGLEYAMEVNRTQGGWIENTNLMSLLYTKTGNPEKALERLDAYLENCEKNSKEANFWDLAVLYNNTGNHSKAIEYLNLAADARIGSVVLIKFSVSFFELKDEPGFIELCNKIGLK